MRIFKFLRHELLVIFECIADNNTINNAEKTTVSLKEAVSPYELDVMLKLYPISMAGFFRLRKKILPAITNG